MAASVEYRQELSFGETMEKENVDDLSLFVDCGGVNLNLDLLQKSNQIHVTFESEFENQLKPETVSIIHGQDFGSDDLLSSLKNFTDYEWLLSPPRHPVNSPEMEEQPTLTDHILISNGQSTSSESKLENPTVDGVATTNISHTNTSTSINGVKSSTTIRRPSPSRKAPSTGTRSATPTTRTKPLRSSTPTCRAVVTAPIKPVTISSKSTSRSSTPSQRPSILPVASKSTSSSRSSTPVQRPSITASSKSASSRSSTPTQRPSNTSVFPNRSSSAIKSRGSSPSVKSRPSKNQAEMNTKPIPKRASCSPSRVHGGVKSVITKARGHLNGNDDEDDDDVNPVLMGTKMVERVVNMRKLAPPKQDDICNQNNASGKLSVSQDNSGFGRSLSRKSFDMALRHLDIRRSMPGNMRATITKIPASSVYSVRPESTKTRTTSASDSPIATSSSASSDHSETGHSYHQPSHRSVGVGFLREP